MPEVPSNRAWHFAAVRYYHFTAATTYNKVKIHESLKKHLIRIKYFPKISNYQTLFSLSAGPPYLRAVDAGVGAVLTGIVFFFGTHAQGKFMATVDSVGVAAAPLGCSWDAAIVGMCSSPFPRFYLECIVYFSKPKPHFFC